MSVKLITYDLNKPGQNYKELHEAIKAIGSQAWWHELDSTWMVMTNLSAHAVSEQLVKHIDESDRMLVLDVSGDSYQGFLSQEAWDWIHKYV